MPVPSISLAQCVPRPPRIAFRAFSATRPATQAGRAVSENPPSSRNAEKSQHVSADPQSSASTQEHRQGDEHPAKQPDPQQDSERSTGFGNVKGGVPGGKEGLEYRSDKK